ncbi:unnamed protein product [Ectocarpus fasciculatus]
MLQGSRKPKSRSASPRSSSAKRSAAGGRASSGPGPQRGRGGSGGRGGNGGSEIGAVPARSSGRKRGAAKREGGGTNDVAEPPASAASKGIVAKAESELQTRPRKMTAKAPRVETDGVAASDHDKERPAAISSQDTGETAGKLDAPAEDGVGVEEARPDAAADGQSSCAVAAAPTMEVEAEQGRAKRQRTEDRVETHRGHDTAKSLDDGGGGTASPPALSHRLPGPEVDTTGGGNVAAVGNGNDMKTKNKNDQPYGPAPPPPSTLPLAESAASSPPRQKKKKKLLTAATNEADSGGGACSSSSSDSDEEYPEGIVGDHWPHPPCDLEAEGGGGVVTGPGDCSKRPQRPQRRTLW